MIRAECGDFAPGSSLGVQILTKMTFGQFFEISGPPDARSPNKNLYISAEMHNLSFEIIKNYPFSFWGNSRRIKHFFSKKIFSPINADHISQYFFNETGCK